MVLTDQYKDEQKFLCPPQLLRLVQTPVKYMTDNNDNWSSTKVFFLAYENKSAFSGAFVVVYYERSWQKTLSYEKRALMENFIPCSLRRAARTLLENYKITILFSIDQKFFDALLIAIDTDSIVTAKKKSL